MNESSYAGVRAKRPDEWDVRTAWATYPDSPIPFRKRVVLARILVKTAWWLLRGNRALWGDIQVRKP